MVTVGPWASAAAVLSNIMNRQLTGEGIVCVPLRPTRTTHEITGYTERTGYKRERRDRQPDRLNRLTGLYGVGNGLVCRHSGAARLCRSCAELKTRSDLEFIHSVLLPRLTLIRNNVFLLSENSTP